MPSVTERSSKFTISENAWRLSQAGYSSMFIMINDQVSVENLLKGIIVASGNDACVALAEGIAGSESNFADMMNEKAGEIGMTSTNFTNSSGINDPDNISTVRDIALMSKYLIQNYPIFMNYLQKKLLRGIEQEAIQSNKEIEILYCIKMLELMGSKLDT